MASGNKVGLGAGLLAAAALVWMASALVPPSPTVRDPMATGPRADRVERAGFDAPPRAAAGPAPAPAAATPGRAAPAPAAGAPVGASALGRSPLERSPGYSPPADPESASVRLGRREAPPVPDLFVGGASSLRELALEILAGLNAGNEPALHRLRVTRTEFEKILWREFPESRPITNISAEDAWSMSEPRSVSGARRAVGVHGGKHLVLQRVESERVQEFTNFVLYRGVTILAAEAETGEVHVVRLAPTVAERKGRFKALLFAD